MLYNNGAVNERLCIQWWSHEIISLNKYWDSCFSLCRKTITLPQRQNHLKIHFVKYAFTLNQCITFF